jgi:hypothetical protein
MMRGPALTPPATRMMAETHGSRTSPRRSFAALGGLMVLAFVVGTLGGCEVDSFFDPSVQGRWEKTPIVLPILEQLDVIDEPDSKVAGLSQVTAEDLVADVSEYVIGPGDVINISIFELLASNTDYTLNKEVDELRLQLESQTAAMEVLKEKIVELERKLATSQKQLKPANTAKKGRGKR